MNYTEALELSRRIKQERPELIPKLFGAAETWDIIIRKTERSAPGYQPVRIGHPFFVRDEDDWIRLRNNL